MAPKRRRRAVPREIAEIVAGEVGAAVEGRGRLDVEAIPQRQLRCIRGQPPDLRLERVRVDVPAVPVEAVAEACGRVLPERPPRERAQRVPDPPLWNTFRQAQRRGAGAPSADAYEAIGARLIAVEICEVVAQLHDALAVDQLREGQP